jgi:hypothetical protein
LNQDGALVFVLARFFARTGTHFARKRSEQQNAPVRKNRTDALGEVSCYSDGPPVF